jgi:hypothetical protein
MTAPAEWRDPSTRQQNPDLELRQTRAALKPLLDKLADWEARHGAVLTDQSVITTTVGLLRDVRAALVQPGARQGEDAGG